MTKQSVDKTTPEYIGQVYDALAQLIESLHVPIYTGDRTQIANKTTTEPTQTVNNLDGECYAFEIAAAGHDSREEYRIQGENAVFDLKFFGIKATVVSYGIPDIMFPERMKLRYAVAVRDNTNGAYDLLAMVQRANEVIAKIGADDACKAFAILTRTSNVTPYSLIFRDKDFKLLGPEAARDNFARIQNALSALVEVHLQNRAKPGAGVQGAGARPAEGMDTGPTT